jgi:ATP-dependent RNA helicase DHX29
MLGQACGQTDRVLPLHLPSDGKYQTKKAAVDWNEDVMIPDDDDDEDKPKDAPVKLEKKYGAKTVATVNNLDERLIPYDLVR